MAAAPVQNQISSLNGQRSGSVLGPGGYPTTGQTAAAAPTQLVVKFQSDGPSAVTECPERWIAEGRSFRDATADQSDSLDQLLLQTGVTRAHALVPGRSGLSTANAKALFAARLAAARTRFAVRATRTDVAPRSLAGGRGDLTNVYVLDLAPGADVKAAAQRYAQDHHVAYAQVNERAVSYFMPNDPYYATAGTWGQPYDDLWGLKRIGMEKAWEASQGEGLVVAVVDTGLDLSHPDIAANVWVNPSEIPGNGIDDDHNGFIDDIHGWNFAGNSADHLGPHGRSASRLAANGRSLG